MRHSTQVQSVTSAPVALSEDLHARTKRYLISMGVRTACFAGAVLIDHPLRWVLVAGAVVLPYVAVVFANAGRERGSDPERVDPAKPTIEGPASTRLPDDE